MIVIDASVFVKLFKVEEDSAIARVVIDQLLDDNEPMLAPTIVLYETLSAALHVGQPFEVVVELFDRLRRFGFTIEDPGSRN